ncbi:MAG: spermidine/putrescine ABC transporter substrate-binding protein [Candidatus Epulonipiscium fishelsonii]|nr:MAG: spermidine/putrescine ABC transporter substrate-binding protein [Epulopiscium sp. AS2M-Bin002]
MKRLLVPAVLTAILMTGCSGEEKQVVKVFNWGDYIDPQTNMLFTEETGIEVLYEEYPTNEEMYAKISGGNARYDVLVPSDYMIEKLIKEDMLAEIDVNALENYKFIDKEFRSLPFDPEDKYSVPFSWGTMGIIYNTTMVEDDIDEWADLWNPEYAKKIFMYDSERESLMVALKKLGYSMNSTDPLELEAAKQELIAQKPLVLAYVVDEGKGKMINEEAAMMVAWAGDAALMISENSDLKYVLPKEGTNLFVDSMVVPKNAENYDNALAYINFMTRPDIAAINMEYLGYSTPSTAARELLSDEARYSEVSYPDPILFETMEMFVDPSEVADVYSRIWTEVKASSKE